MASLVPYLEKWVKQLGCDRVTASSEGLTCCCPFHTDRKPSFTINGSTGLWLCWSANCPYGQGNLVQFLHYSFGYSIPKCLSIVEEMPILIDMEKIEKLPPWELRHVKPQDEAMNEGLLGLYDRCPRYLLNRGFDKSILKEFEVGYDKATDYAVIPCRDEYGRLVGISKRACSEQEPKWVHEHFKKGNILYNLERARWDRSVTPFRKRNGIVVEGQLDTMWMHQWGWPNSVSTLSANVTDRQVGLLSKSFDSITIFFDNDVPGFVGAYYLAKKLLKRLPVTVVQYPVTPDGSKLDPSRLNKGQIADRLNNAEDGFDFIRSSASLVEWIREENKKRLLRNVGKK